MQNFNKILKEAKYYSYFCHSEINLLIVSNQESIISIIWQCEFDIAKDYLCKVKEYKSKPINSLIKQLNEYLKGERKYFDVSTKLIGTEFQIEVWNSFTQIPYGITLTYEQFAYQCTQKTNYNRAVASNIGRNPLPIIYPCHRVIAKNQNSGGFAGGDDIKKYLINLERKLHD